MPSIKEKLAALRAKRVLQENAPAKVDSALDAAAAAVGQPQVSWDADYKERLERSVPDERRNSTELSEFSSDEDEGDLVVLPPPVRKLTAAAQRQLWRIKEIERAKERAAKSLMESRPDGFEEIELCSEEPSPNKEEDGKGEEESGEIDDEEEDVAEEWEDEEEAALESAEQMEEEGEDEAENHDDDDHEANAISEPACTDKKEDDAILRKNEQDLCPDLNLQETSQQKREGENKTDVPDDGMTGADSEKGNAGSTAESRCEQAQSEVSPVMEDESPSPVNEEEVVRRPNVIRKGSFAFAKSTREPQLRQSDFVEDEAEDEDSRGGPDLSAIPERDDTDSSDADIIDDEMDEHHINASEKKKLAAFHQKWLVQKETNEINALKADPRSLLDDEEDNVLAKTAVENDELPNLGNEDARDNASVIAEGSADGEFDCDDSLQPTNYVETMFLRDDSRSKYLEEVEDEQPDDGGVSHREKARALWKARQKIKEDLFRENENSLSRFDIFGDTDKSRGTLYRAQIEGACRPASKKTVDERSRTGLENENATNRLKRNAPWSAGKGMPEWERRNSVLNQRERKRQRSISVGKWSFAAHGEKQTVPAKASKASSLLAGQSSLGATYQPMKSRARGPLADNNVKTKRRNGRMASNRRSKGPTSFKGLLGILGSRAEADDL